MFPEEFNPDDKFQTSVHNEVSNLIYVAYTIQLGMSYRYEKKYYIVTDIPVHFECNRTDHSFY